ncbi:glycosyltransferase family 4 protein [Clostridium ganghwense]|uniref:Glycosyltransferase family 4 protein n=1 Tax=Clostridium ganghwense TaxID=312089 RepID=A0ABT4CNA8_9CLOT|nr:glycosyltransferase family 4 protein [Clostridium ganghwense]MCY6370530.1 glycosyltransferase family 4 protein [Clostridium ganghwense]
MRILLCIRDDYVKNFAGDSMQVLKTAEYLRKLGVKVYINDGRIVDYSNYDIIHLFNLTRITETYRYYKIACKYKKYIVISPIYWDLLKYYVHVNDKENINVWKKYELYRKEILYGCKRIYPNSKIEKELLNKEYGKRLPCTVIYNGVDILNNKYNIYNFKKKYKLNDYVLCAARICPRKNQLALAKACKELGYKLVLIGNINNRKYYKYCIKYKNVRYLGFMNSNNLYSAYSCARVHVLPSFLETPGLTSLEAAALGCNVVSTEIGSAREYFQDLALYYNPYKENEILDIVDKGFKRDKNDTLKKHVIKNYSWDVCIKELYKSYRDMLK